MIEFEIKAMNCSDCVATITRAVTALDPAATLRAELPTHRVRIETRLRRAQIEQALKQAHYPPTHVL